MMEPLSLYIHIPFCVQKCAYCDFASWANVEGQYRQYFDALATEIRHWSETTDFGLLSDRFYIYSAYIGGGTPTAVDERFISSIIDQSLFLNSDRAEITIEGNPGTLTPKKLDAYLKAGVNRLSLGAQSFDDELLSSLGRIHKGDQIVEAVQMARAVGYDNINLDLMYGLPGQTMAQWQDTLKMAIAQGVEHISAYSLILEPGTPLHKRVSHGEVSLPGEDEVIAMQRTAISTLSQAGYRRYEISNYAKPGCECRHNLVYWNRGDYLGFGCAAHSMIDNCRFHNPETLEAYLRGERMRDFEKLTDRDILEEYIMLGTRTAKGIEISPGDAAHPKLRRLYSEGLVIIDGGNLRLTERGMEVQNAVVLELSEVLCG